MKLEEIHNIISEGENDKVEFNSTFDDRIEFSNPGGLLVSLKTEDLYTDIYLAKHRNRLLAVAFYLTGEIAKEIEITKHSVERNISKLKNMNYIERFGGRKIGFWKILKQ